MKINILYYKKKTQPNIVGVDWKQRNKILFLSYHFRSMLNYYRNKNNYESRTFPTQVFSPIHWTFPPKRGNSLPDKTFLLKILNNNIQFKSINL